MREFKNKRNPVLPLDIHIPDSEAHVMPDNRLYVYGSYDDRSDMFCSEKYHVVSTADMENWTIHEVALRGQDIPWFGDETAPKYPGIDWSNPTPFIRKMFENAEHSGEKEKFEKQPEGEKPALLFAPDAIYKNGTYYLYFCMSDDSEGVAVSASPEGPFENPIQLPCGGIDPAIFTDEDGQSYFYWGQLFSHGVKLNDDMISFDEKAVVHNLVTEEEHFFHEGSSMRKIGNTYYYVYADMERGKPTALGYSTSKSPLGPFEYRGIIIDNAACDPASWNNHGSIECVNGQWYVFYHRCSRGVQQYRRLCIEPITINADGSIGEVKMTSQGIGEPFEPGEKIMGYQACELAGTVYIDADEEYEEKLTNISDGDEAVFRYVRSAKPFGKIKITASGSGTIEVLMNGQAVGIVKIKDGVQTRDEIHMPGGEYELTLRFLEAESLELMELILYGAE
ncbi:family 43 glycosylhydrolase [Konateibacter massiliensis]|uniref:family 43 glycosylhydrolase n=1 Tax=Konateibacter massiliensis TaxID=2002841 RepID=UPI000C1513FB|nr:family 43 glycosylhydrolase [Konateibacter massiliensis]